MDSCIFVIPLEFCKFNIYIRYIDESSERLLFSGVQVFDLQKYIRRAFQLSEVCEVFLRYGETLDKFKEHSL